MACWMAATRCGSAITQSRWTAPYSSRISVAGGGGGLVFPGNAARRVLFFEGRSENCPGWVRGVGGGLKPVGFRTGKSVLVAEDDARRIIFELSCADKAPACAVLLSTRQGKFLRVGVKRRRGVLHENAVVNPAIERGGGACVDVVLRRIIRIDAALLDSNEVVRVSGVILLLHGGRNFVVGLRQDALKGSVRRIITVGAKGINLGHGFSGGV